MALALLLQNAIVTRHALAMAAGVEVCSASGHVRVGLDGHPVGSASHDDHGCCGAAHLAVPPTLPVWQAVATAPAAPDTPATTARRAAAWLAPLSRGPPAGA